MSLQPVLGKMLGFQPDGGPSNFCGFDTYPDGTGYTVINHRSTLICSNIDVHTLWSSTWNLKKVPLQKGEIRFGKKKLIFIHFQVPIRSNFGGWGICHWKNSQEKLPFSYRTFLGFFPAKNHGMICSPEAATCLLYGAIFGAILGEDGQNHGGH